LKIPISHRDWKNYLPKFLRISCFFPKHNEVNKIIKRMGLLSIIYPRWYYNFSKKMYQFFLKRIWNGLYKAYFTYSFIIKICDINVPIFIYRQALWPIKSCGSSIAILISRNTSCNRSYNS